MSSLYFRCLDCNCQFQESSNRSDKDFYFDAPEENDKPFWYVSDENTDQDCPNNEKIKLKFQGIEMSGGFKKSSLMNKEQKQEMLKKRSSVHFKKEIKEKSIEMQKNYYEKEMPKHIANNSKPPTI